MDFTLEDLVDENSLDDNLDDTISEMFTDEHALDYSSPPLWDDYDDELFDLETVNDDTYDDLFYSKEEKIKESKLLIDELDLPRSSDFLPFPECDSVFYEDFSEVDALSSTNNEDKDLDPPLSLYELPFQKEVPGLGALLSKWISDKRTKNKVKNDKTEHGIEKREKYKEKVKAKSKSSALMPSPKPLIPYPSRRNDERRREKANDQIEKLYKIFKDLSFEISLTDALILMPKFASTLKALIRNKEKLSDMARTPLNEHCSAVILNKLPEKHIVDFDADPQVPLILGRSFLKTRRALIDVYEGELTLRVGKEVVTFNLDQTLRYSSNYDDMTANRIDVNEMACEEYSQEVLGFSDMILSGNPTPYYDPIVSTSSLTLTPFGDSDFLLEEVDAFLALEDDPTSPKVDDSYYDLEGDILLLEAYLNDDPSPPPN
ncbi:hypothetical protein Tco_0525525 [Tanacetum coccineum]